MKIDTGDIVNRPLVSGGAWDRSVIQKIMDSLRNGDTHYVEVPGNGELRRCIGEYLDSSGLARGGEVMVTAGVQEARFLTMQVLGKTRGSMAMPQVVHPGVREVLALRDLECEYLEVAADQRMLVSPAALREMSAAVKVLYIESPSRLTGACYAREEIAEIAVQCRDRQIALIVDAGLHPWLEDRGESLPPGLQIDDRTCVIGEAWPGAGIEELYIGYIAASEATMKRLTIQKQVISICTSAPSQNGAIAAGGDYPGRRTQILAAMREIRQRLESKLHDGGVDVLPGPVVGFTVCRSDSALRNKLEAAKVGYADSTWFGRPGFIQLPVTEQVVEALR
jgi:aspartate/methionine/tyrosine aminotransferase